MSKGMVLGEEEEQVCDVGVDRRLLGHVMEFKFVFNKSGVDRVKNVGWKEVGENLIVVYYLNL